MSNEGNTSPETADAPLSNDEAALRLAGSILDSEDAAPQTDPDSESVEVLEDEVEDVVVGDEDEEDDLPLAADDEYETGDDVTDSGEELLIEINGQEIPLDEIGKGYMRQQDYTVKTQEIAAQNKQMADLQASIAAERQHLKQMLEMSASAPAEEVDWVQLATDDPLEYTRLKAVHDATQDQRQAQQLEHDRLTALNEQEHQRKFQGFVQEQAAKMVENIPELAGESASQYKANISSYMEGVGYSKDELSQLFDHRAVLAFDKARKYDALMSKQGTVRKKAKGKPTVLRPGAKRGKKMSQAQAHDKGKARLRNSGSVDDAVALLMG